MTPTIYKLAYVNNVINTEGFVLFQNDGNVDVVYETFETEADLLRYVDKVFDKVGEITDYGLYIRKSFNDLNKV
jgi:hypothetical protein